jgi:hypothetical protein
VGANDIAWNEKRRDKFESELFWKLMIKETATDLQNHIKVIVFFDVI